MANPFEGPPGKPEVAMRDCPHFNDSGKVKDSSGQDARCKPCNGTGQIRSNG